MKRASVAPLAILLAGCTVAVTHAPPKPECYPGMIEPDVAGAQSHVAPCEWLDGWRALGDGRWTWDG